MIDDAGDDHERPFSDLIVASKSHCRGRPYIAAACSTGASQARSQACRGRALQVDQETAEHPMPSRIASRTYGTVSADRRKEMSGLEFVQGLADGSLPLNTIAKTLGYDVTEAASGRVAVTAEPNGTHLNPAGTVHGGLAATLLDSCMGLAIQSTLEKGVGQTTLEFKISLVRPITPETGPIKAEGVVLSRGRRVGTAEGRLTDREGRLLAHGTATYLIFPS
jgi:uncharacterized protein (TIGR00369 family)